MQKKLLLLKIGVFMVVLVEGLRRAGPLITRARRRSSKLLEPNVMSDTRAKVFDPLVAEARGYLDPRTVGAAGYQYRVGVRAAAGSDLDGA